MPSLPTTSLTGHFMADVNTHVYTDFSMTTAANNGDNARAWDDEGDGISDISLQSNGGTTDPKYRTGASSPMLNSCIDFDGSDDLLKSYTQAGSNKAISNFIAAGAYTILVAFYADASGTDSATSYENDSILSDVGGFFALYLRSSNKIGVYNWDGSEDKVEIAVTYGASHVVRIRHDSGSIYISLDGGSESSTASGNTTTLTNQLIVGTGYSGTHAYNGRVGELAIYNAAISGSNLSDATQYFTDKWLGAASFDPTAYPWFDVSRTIPRRYEVVAY